MVDALEHLIEEHRQVESLLDELADSEAGPEREAKVAELETALSTHMAVEEQFVYPLVKDAVGAEEEEEAETEHQLVRDGLTNLKELVGESGFGAAVEMVKAGIGHHVTEEENEVFPKLRAAAADRITALGDPQELIAQVRPGGGVTREELYEKAKEAGVAGRSTMTKSELAEALEPSSD